MIKINFLCKDKFFYGLLEKPYPATKIQPNWLKKLPIYKSTNKIDDLGNPTTTVKKCMPFLDANNAGYYITLQSDVWVENDKNGNIKIKWATPDFDVVSSHTYSQIENYPIPEGYDTKSIFKWENQWIVRTPSKWSCLFTHPIHFDELPFMSLTGLVDTDKFPETINFPFFIKKDFEGLIPKGTPIIQVIPFKRECFTATYSIDDGKLKNLWAKAKTVFFDRYKKFFREPKHFTQSESKCPFSKLLL
jgi:hypothetical protein